MDLLFKILFYGMFVATIVAVIVETFIVNSRLTQIRGKGLPLIFSMKAQLQRLEDYKSEYGKGREDLWYKYLKAFKKHSLKSLGILIPLMLLALMF